MDETRVRAAGKEFLFAFAAIFIPALLALLTGIEADLQAGGVGFPDVSAAAAILSSAALAGVLAGIKAVLWFFTGTN